MKLEEEYLKQNLCSGSRRDKIPPQLHNGAGLELEAGFMMQFSGEMKKNSSAVDFFRLDPAFPSSYNILLSNTWQLHAPVESMRQGMHPQPSPLHSARRWLHFYKTHFWQVNADEMGYEKHE